MPQIQEQIVAVVVLAVDVPVIMQLENQQSKYENLDVLQFLFIDRVLDIPVVTQTSVRAVQKLCRKPSRFHGCSSWALSTRPLLCNDRCLECGTVLKTVEVPQSQLIDVGSCRCEHAATSSSSSAPWGSSDQFIDKVWKV